jgi:hypothetical protein
MDRWQDDPARADRIVGRLAEVERAHRRLVAAQVAAKDPNQERWMLRRSADLAAGARKGLDGAIGMALYDQAQVPVEEIAQAAGETVEYVERVQARLRGLGT